jgi:hypothetical protein
MKTLRTHFENITSILEKQIECAPDPNKVISYCELYNPTTCKCSYANTVKATQSFLRFLKNT